jgi:hypothetical protein
MSALQTALLVGLFAVAAVHTKSRVAGAGAACLWCVCAAVYGGLEFQTRDTLRFLGIETPAWLYFAFVGALAAFNVAVIARAFRRRRRPPGTSPSPNAP